MKRFLTTLFMLLGLWQPSIAMAAESETLMIESRIESEIEKILNKHIDEALYVIMVTVDEKTLENLYPSKAPQDQTLPYSSIKINPRKLSETFYANIDDFIFTIPVKIQMMFDESVSLDKQKAILDKVKLNLNIDDKNRTLSAVTVKLTTPVKDNKEALASTPAATATPDKKPELPQTPAAAALPTLPANQPGEANSIDVESSKLEVERTKLELEREKTEASRREFDLKKELDENKKLAQQKTEVKEKPKTAVDRVQDFQLGIIGFILGLCLLLFSFIGSAAFRRAASIVSEGLAKISANQSNSSQGGGAYYPEAVAAREGATTRETVKTEIANEGPSPVMDSKLEGFLNLVEEKIEVLSNEGNFDFYRHFIDLSEENTAYAAAILLSVKGEFAKKLLGNVPTDVIEKISHFLAEQDGLAQAKKSRRMALEQFYAAIAMDEFLDSPLIKVKDIGWLTKLSTEELRDLSLALEKQERTFFLACFSPTRLALLLDKCKDETQKEKLIDCIANIDKVTVNDVDGLFKKVEIMYAQRKKEDTDKVRKLVDGPYFVAKVISTMKHNDRSKLVDKLSDRAEFMEAIRHYYIPFESVAELSVRNVEDIFSKRPVGQLALIMFSTNQQVRDAITNVVPEGLQDALKDELNTLINDRAAAKKYELQSQKLHQEICRYLLLLNKDGLLEYVTEGKAS